MDLGPGENEIDQGIMRDDSGHSSASMERGTFFSLPASKAMLAHTPCLPQRLQTSPPMGPLLLPEPLLRDPLSPVLLPSVVHRPQPSSPSQLCSDLVSCLGELPGQRETESDWHDSSFFCVMPPHRPVFKSGAQA
jgi:hypothetical protein